ncbi:MAG: dTDP-4-dehydrorhamnose 3,5-epimerase [Chitinophagaceae bacterium]|jgi:dTDP-4-dehydrorhamnose 3,5-epimerase|nr:dTDP-4-dehydrorhamnose 3,5-epimerase [Chitinophagaceae bacterium]
MEIVETPLSGCYLIKNTLFHDDRGYFFESFNRQRFAEKTGQDVEFVQDNQSKSSFGVVRGLHFQKGEWAQAKLVRVLQGRVIDVAVDLRPDSNTFGKSFCVELSDDNAYQLFIPRGFAHGFSVVSPEAVFFYKCDNYYKKDAEGGIHPLDATIGINWGLQPDEIILSGKDSSAPVWNDFLKTI